MSTSVISAAPEAKEPKRERGKLRVAALLNAGSELFVEKGYDATTMTEIAQRAGASIGSLYQFFPSKEALAEALFNRYAERVSETLESVAQRAPDLDAAGLADMLVDMMLTLRKDRDANIALSESIASIVERRKPIRHIARGKIAAIIQSVNAALSDDQAMVSAAAILQVMKSVEILAQSEQETGLAFVAEVRTMLAVYISHIAGT